MSHHALLIAVQDLARALQIALDAVHVFEHHLRSVLYALRIFEHHLRGGAGQGGPAPHVAHGLAGFKGLAGAPLGVAAAPLGVAAAAHGDAEEPAPTPLAQPTQAEPSASEAAGGRVERTPHKPRGRRAEARPVAQRREVPPDAISSHCRACHEEVFAVSQDALLLDRDGTDHALSCPMSRVLGAQEERPVKARAHRKAPSAPNSPPPPGTHAP